MAARAGSRGVHTDLLAAQLIPIRLWPTTRKRYVVAESDWVYRRAFAVDAALMAEQHVFLVCDGWTRWPRSH